MISQDSIKETEDYLSIRRSNYYWNTRSKKFRRSDSEPERKRFVIHRKIVTVAGGL